MTQYDDMLQNDPVLSKFLAVSESPRAKGVDRRGFMKLTGIAGGGLVLAFSLKGKVISEAMAADEMTGGADLNAFVQIRPDNTIRIYAKNPEVGQGVKTSLPQIVADEMDADWQSVVVEQAPLDGARFGGQFAGGSLSIPMNWMSLRQTGAGARSMLVAAAAKKWGVPAEEIKTANSMLTHGDKSATYGEMAADAAKMPVPDPKTLKLKDPSEFTLIGKRLTGVDNHALVTGQPLFAMDMTVPGMVYANLTQAPQIGAKVKSANLEHIKSLPGIEDAIIMEGAGAPGAFASFNPAGAIYLPGVAIIGNSTGAVLAAKKELQVEWDNSGVVNTDTWSEFVKQANALKAKEGETVTGIAGDPDPAFSNAAKTVEGFYTFNFVTHAQLEPNNCIAWVKEDGTVELWAPAQLPDQGATAAAAMAGVDRSKVTLHMMRIGGGFGRKLANDFVVEATAISAKIKKPVKLMRTREDDTLHDFYRPGGFNAFWASLDENGKLTGWKDHFISFSPDGKVRLSGPPGAPPPKGPQKPSYYPANVLDNARVTQTNLKSLTPTGPMRAPGDNTYGWVVNSFLHEVSQAAGRDHVEFMLEVLGEPRALGPGFGPSFHTRRAADVIKKVAEMSGWGRQLPQGTGIGFGFYYSHQGHVAHAVEVSVDANKHVTVNKVWSAYDVGPVVNMSGAENQAQGTVVDCLSNMALEVNIINGVIQENNFHQYPMRRIMGTPEMEIAFLQSEFAPTGMGEPGVASFTPAVTNAIYEATGERIRQLPIQHQGFTI